MDLDDEVCFCFHVTKRKVWNFLRVERPKRVGQLSDCFGAGTGCGWCRATLQRYFDEARELSAAPADEISSGEHALGRARYLQDGRGTPPEGATPPPTLADENT